MNIDIVTPRCRLDFRFIPRRPDNKRGRLKSQRIIRGYPESFLAQVQSERLKINEEVIVGHRDDTGERITGRIQKVSYMKAGDRNLRPFFVEIKVVLRLVCTDQNSYNEGTKAFFGSFKYMPIAYRLASRYF